VQFVVYGAGAIGGVVGARLFQNGHDVVLIARGAHYDAIAAHGLRVQSGDEDVTLPIPVISEPAQLARRDDDIILLATKSQDTMAAATALVTAGVQVPIVSLQNGVENERTLLRFFTDVYAVCVMSPTAHLVPGVVQAYSAPVSGLLDIGRYPRDVDPRAEEIAAAFASSTFDSVTRSDIMRWKYTKLLMNLGNAVEALCAPSDESVELVRRARAEGVACLEAAGIAFASTEEDRDRRGEIMRLRPIAGTRRGGGSSWQSLERGTGTIEVDFLNGEIVLLGRQHRVATPVNALLQRCANDAARNHARPASMSGRDLLAELET
jgi:2-dehydropantoate 2-reductase